MSNDWETGICGCCEVKDCGVGCCVKLYCVRPRARLDPPLEPPQLSGDHMLEFHLAVHFTAASIPCPLLTA